MNRPILLSLLVFSCLAAFSASASAQAEAEAEPAPMALRFHGQYRLNSYMLRGEEGVEVLATRLRARPTFDMSLPEHTELHVQLNIGHIQANILQATRDQTGGPSFGLRHMVLTRSWGPSFEVDAGLVPLPDRFGDTLFSADWDFNPLALVMRGEGQGWRWRVGAGRLVEATEAWDADDNATILSADLDYGPVGISAYGLSLGEGASAVPALQGDLGLLGMRYQDDLGPLGLRLHVVGSYFSGSQGGSDFKALGAMGLAEGSTRLGDLTLKLLTALGTGDSQATGTDSGAFLTPMSLLGTHGYWGYTGKLTLQGPTDTGIDDPVNLDGGSYGNQNLGRGLMTVQLKAEHPLADFATASLGAGWFRSWAKAQNQSQDIGLDLYAQVRWQLDQLFSLETGLDLTSFGPGYHGATDDARRNSLLAFSRLQLEY